MSSESRRAAVLLVIQHRLAGCQQMLDWYGEQLEAMPDDPRARRQLDYCLRARSHMERELCEAEGRYAR